MRVGMDTEMLIPYRRFRYPGVQRATNTNKQFAIKVILYLFQRSNAQKRCVMHPKIEYNG